MINSKFSYGPTTNKPILLDRSIAKSCFDVTKGCGQEADLEDKKIEMLIRKAGCCDYLIKYPAFEVNDNNVCFYWDDLLYNLEPGRYIGDLFIDARKSAEYQFEIGSSYKIGGINNIERKGEVHCGD